MNLVELLSAENLPSPGISAAAVADVGPRPTPQEWARFEEACAAVRAAGRAA